MSSRLPAPWNEAVPGRPLVVSHRAGGNEAPENTLAALRSAEAAGSKVLMHQRFSRTLPRPEEYSGCFFSGLLKQSAMPPGDADGHIADLRGHAGYIPRYLAAARVRRRHRHPAGHKAH